MNEEKYAMFTPEVISTIENALDNKLDFYHDRYPHDDPQFIEGVERVRVARQAIHDFSETDIRTVYVVMSERRYMGVTVAEISDVYLDKKAAEAQVDKLAFEAGQGDPREAANYYVEDHKLHLPWEYIPPEVTEVVCDHCGASRAIQIGNGHILCGQCQRDREDCL